jgi:hypothetical protein
MNPKLKHGITREQKTINGLSMDAFAIIKDPQDPSTWLLPHHTKAILKYKPNSVDWRSMGIAVAMLSKSGYHGERVKADTEDMIAAARHLEEHYFRANKPVPNTLLVLI